MKRLCTAVLALLLLFSLCGCGAKTMESVKETARKKGYEVTEFSEERQKEMVYQMAVSGTKKGLIGACGIKDAQKGSVIVAEFERRSDAEIIYKAFKAGLEAGETVDLSGCILIYGTQSVVKDLF